MKKQQLDGMTISPTDYRMTAKRFGFEWVISFKSVKKYQDMQKIACDQFGNYIWFPLSRRYINGNVYRRELKFACQYGKHRSNRYEEDKIYFRTKEDLDMIVVLLTLANGID